MATFELISATYSTIVDYTRYFDAYPHLVGPKGDLKDVQRPWVLETLRDLIPRGSAIVDLGGSRCELAACLMNDYIVTIVDPYDGSGNGPTNPDFYRNKFPNLTIIQGVVGPSIALGDQAAVISTSVVEHIPIKHHAETIAGIAKVLRPGGYSIHAIDFTVRAVRDFLMDQGDIAQSFIKAHGVAFDADEIRCNMLADVETYYLSPLMYQQWRKGRSICLYPWRQVGSLNVILRHRNTSR